MHQPQARPTRLLTGLLVLAGCLLLTETLNAQSTVEKTFTNSINMEFILIPAGTFKMGSENGDQDERPVHQVTISKAFYLGKYEVTQGQWQTIMGKNPSAYPGDPNRPVDQVSWDDAQAFLVRLNAKEGGQSYRLPTEAEWEYAARAGTTTIYSFGNDPKQLGTYAWFRGNAERHSHPVGQKQPNAWGLYDMLGNVWEWVQDWDGKYPTGPVTDPKGSATGTYRMRRGCAWNNEPGVCRVANRYSVVGYRDDFLGFRVVRSLP
ncbi:MAG: formylglycine-generating enzyme family protein [Candidatus Tectomicrobia bacterium]|uniref:Formylglycine-generating enzyme family protein n=1 Tax=Tectimicrobiota bacterium TaxID=2528274 RepID=A0A937VXC6_UNCTE|nr:formylglycine-generating enzyme family protein [Candidatus Tectomicrobia bacterium]